MWISEEKNIPLEEITDYVKLMTYILLTNFFSANICVIIMTQIKDIVLRKKIATV